MLMSRMVLGGAGWCREGVQALSEWWPNERNIQSGGIWGSRMEEEARG